MTPPPLAMHDKRREQGEASKKEILGAAARLMARHGYAGTSLAMIAKESGLPSSSIYWHFKSKEGILASILEAGAERFFTLFQDVEPTTGTAADRLRAALLATGRSLILVPEHAQFLRLQLRVRLNFEHDPQSAPFHEIAAKVRDGGREFMERLIADAFGEEAPSVATELAATHAELGIATIVGVFLSMQEVEAAAVEDQVETLLGQAVEAFVLLLCHRAGVQLSSEG